MNFFYFVPLRLMSTMGLNNEDAGTEKQAESIVVFNPEKTKEQTPVHLDQGKITDENGQQLFKYPRSEKTKETDSSSC